MSTILDVAKQMTDAWTRKDEEGFRECLHDEYLFKGPMMEFKSPNEAVEFMHRCPFESTSENCEVVVEGNTLVHIFNWNVTAPFKANIPMVEVLEFASGKVKRARLYFDPALFPAEVKEQMMAATAA